MPRLFAALSNPAFLFLWLAELFSQTAMNMMNFILILFAYHITTSNTGVSGIVLAFTIPALLFGVLAGVYVDRWNKKNVLIITNVLRALILLLLVFFQSNLVVLYGVTFVISIITQFFIPAETPMIPLLVKESELFSANALFSMAWFGSVFIAYGLSGPLLLFMGKTNSLFALVFCFLLAAVSAWLIRFRAKPHTGMLQKPQLWREVKQAFTVIWENSDVTHAFLLLALTQVITLIISVLGPGFAKDILRIPVDAFPLVFITPAIIGMVAGAAFVTSVFYRFNRHKSATLGLFVASASVIIMSYGRELTRLIRHDFHFAIPEHTLLLWVMILIAVMLGVANAFMFVPSNTLVQEQTSDESRGRIYGTLSSVVALLSLVPVVIVGSLADLFGVEHVLLGVGVGIGLLAVARLKL